MTNRIQLIVTAAGHDHATNLGALKIVLGAKRFALYIAFVMAFSLVTGLIVNLVV